MDNLRMTNPFQNAAWEGDAATPNVELTGPQNAQRFAGPG